MSEKRPEESSYSRQSPKLVIPIPSSQPLYQVPSPRPGEDLREKLQEYYQDYLRLFKKNKQMETTLVHVKTQMIELENKLQTIQTWEKSSQEEKRKRHRRNASQISRNWLCPHSGCQKSYGTEGSLAQHVKLKHPGFQETEDYRKALKQMGEQQSKNM